MSKNNDFFSTTMEVWCIFDIRPHKNKVAKDMNSCDVMILNMICTCFSKDKMICLLYLEKVQRLTKGSRYIRKGYSAFFNYFFTCAEWIFLFFRFDKKQGRSGP